MKNNIKIIKIILLIISGVIFSYFIIQNIRYIAQYNNIVKAEIVNFQKPEGIEYQIKQLSEDGEIPVYQYKIENKEYITLGSQYDIAYDKINNSRITYIAVNNKDPFDILNSTQIVSEIVIIITFLIMDVILSKLIITILKDD